MSTCRPDPEILRQSPIRDFLIAKHLKNLQTQDCSYVTGYYVYVSIIHQKIRWISTEFHGYVITAMVLNLGSIDPPGFNGEKTPADEAHGKDYCWLISFQ